MDDLGLRQCPSISERYSSARKPVDDPSGNTFRCELPEGHDGVHVCATAWGQALLGWVDYWSTDADEHSRLLAVVDHLEELAGNVDECVKNRQYADFGGQDLTEWQRGLAVGYRAGAGEIQRALRIALNKPWAIQQRDEAAPPEPAPELPKGFVWASSPLNDDIA